MLIKKFVFINRFGKFYDDDINCLAPLVQCCMVRLTTVQRLVRMYSGPLSLGALINNTLNTDPVSPVLIQPQLNALDRRLTKLLKEISQCLHTPEIVYDNGEEVERMRTISDVIIDDGYV